MSMIDSPRKVVGSVLKYMGASYNTKNIDLQVPGGRNAVQENLASLGKQEEIPGATPSAIKSSVIEVPEEHTKGKPKLDTNLIAVVPPPEIVTRCEFLDPLSDATLSDYKLLIGTMQIPNPGIISRV